MSRPNRTATADELVVVQALEAGDLHFEAALGKYRLLGTLGHGGMADVYLAVADGPEGFRKLCVLKTLRDSMAQDEDFRAMFLDEARLAARLNHPNVVQTFEVDDSEGRLLLAMEYVEGQPVTRVRRRLSPEDFPLTAHIRVLCDVLDALDYAHHLTDFDGSVLGIVHRDVTPHNILVGYDGRVKLVDFGIAKIVDAPEGQSGLSGPTQAGSVIGTPNFMSPEQLTVGGAPDPLTDIWSLGATVFSAMIGRIPFEGEVLGDIVLKVCTAPMPVPSSLRAGLPPGFDAWFARACNRDRAGRFQTVEELADSLLRVCGADPSGVETATMSEDRVQYQLKAKHSAEELEALARQPHDGMSAKSALLAGIIVGVALMVGVLGFLAWKTSDGPPSPAPAVAPSK